MTYDPIINGVQYVTYHRYPTKEEIAFGQGAMHYRDFPLEEVLKFPNNPSYYNITQVRKWVVADGHRYYR